MVRPHSAVLIAILTLGGGTAFAASLGFDASTLGMAMVNTPRCTGVGLGVIQNLSASTVVSVTVSSLPSACGSATLQVTVNNLLTSSSGSLTVPSGGGAVTVTLATAVAITAVEEIDLVLTGP